MIGELLSGNLWLRLIAQATLCVAAGLAASYLLRHRAARAHQALLTALLASLLMPGAYILARHFHLGVLPPAPMPRVEPLPDGLVPSLLTVETTYETLPQDTTPSVPWGMICLSGWTLLSTVLLGRLVLQFLLGLRLLVRSRPLASERLRQAVESARVRMGVMPPVQVRGNARVESPMIWCWLRKPVLLVPTDVVDHKDKVDWVGVFCHELAHFKRRDHLSGLFAEMLAALLAWHPLVWWARARLAGLSEQACDDWVLAGGQSGVNYAETLLNLAGQKQMALVPTVAGRRRTMKARIHRIIEDRGNDPRAGTRWAAMVSVLAVLVVVSVGFAQRRPAERPEQKSETTAERPAPPERRETMPDWQRKVLERKLEEIAEQIKGQETLIPMGGAPTPETKFELDLLREMAGQIERRLRGTEGPTQPRTPTRAGEWVYRDGQWALLSPEGKEMAPVTPGQEPQTRARRRSPPEVAAPLQGERTVGPTDGARQRGSDAKLETRAYALQYVSAERIRAVLGTLLEAPEAVTIFANGRKVAVSATVENHLQIEGLLKALDVPAEGRGQEQDHLVTAIYKLKYARLGRMREIVQSLLGESGKVTFNERTNSLIVTATPERLRSVVDVINRLDAPTNGPASKTEVEELRDQMRQLQERMQQMQRRLEQVDEQSSARIRPLGTPPAPRSPAETQESAIVR